MNNALVLITNSENESFGTGFVIKKEKDYCYVLTCAHVVESSPNSLFADSVKANIVQIGSSDGLDLALLKVKIDREPLLLADGVCGEFKIKGFRHFKNSDHILEPIDCKLDTKVEFRPKNGAMISGWKLNVDVSDTVEKGYSGSPLICKDSGKVLAVVSNRKGNKNGFAISIVHLIDVWEDIPDDIIDYSVYEEKKQKSIDDWWYIKAIREYPFVSILLISIVLLYMNKEWIYSNYVNPEKLDNNISTKLETLIGVVKDMDGGTPLGNVIIWIEDKDLEYKTKENGSYEFNIEGNKGDIIDIDFEKDDYSVCDDNDKKQRLGEKRDVLLCKDF